MNFQLKNKFVTDSFWNPMMTAWWNQWMKVLTEGACVVTSPKEKANANAKANAKANANVKANANPNAKPIKQLKPENAIDADALISEWAHQIVSSQIYNIYILYYYISIY
jgi:hypothetical protein